MRTLPGRYKVDIRVKPGSHQSEEAGRYHPRLSQLHEDVETDVTTVNKQLNDKERVAAALENNALLDVVERCLATTRRSG